MFELQSASRLPRWPWWAVALVMVWGAGVAVATFVFPAAGPLCVFRRLTGLPCPACGGSRGVRELVEGHWARGWLHNPLLFTLLAVAAVWLLVRLASGRQLWWSPSPRARAFAWIVAGAALAANWIFLIVTDR